VNSVVGGKVFEVNSLKKRHACCLMVDGTRSSEC